MDEKKYFWPNLPKAFLKQTQFYCVAVRARLSFIGWQLSVVMRFETPTLKLSSSQNQRIS